MSTNSLYPGTTNGVCVTSIIKDKIREYMMGDSSHRSKSPVEISICEVEKDKVDSVIHENKSINKQDPVSTTDLVLPSSLAVSMHNSTEPCPHKQDIVTSVRRIGNSLDALLQESKKASRTKPVKKSTLTNQQNADRLFIASDQIRSRKSVSLHDICEEYIQFITVNSSVSADEEAISTTSENETEVEIKNQEIELEIIPVNAAASIRNSQISVITINENSPRKPMNSVIIQSVEEMHVAVENECEKSNGDNKSNAVVDKLTTDKATVEKESADDSDIFTNLNGVKGSLDAAPAAEEPQQNIASVIKEQEKNVDEKKEQDDSDKDKTVDEVDDVVEKIDEKPTSNGLSHNVADDIDEDDVADEDTVADEPSPSSQPAADVIEEQPPAVPTVSEKSEPESAVVESNVPTPEPEQKSPQPEATPVCQNEPPTIEEPAAESPAVETDEKMETDCEESTEQKSPDVRLEAVDEKMDTDEAKTDSPPETVPSPAEDATPSPAASTEKLQDSTDVKEEPSIEGKPPSPVVAAKEIPTSDDATDPDDEMDTADVESVIRPLEDDKTAKPTVEEPKPDIITPIVEIKIVEPAPKEREPEAKIKPIEEPITEAKIEKKSEPEKQPVAKETATAASVKRKAADTGEETEQDREGGVISSSSSNCSGSDADNTQDCKRIRFDESIFEEDERERLIREFVERSTETSDDIGKNCDKLQQEIAALSDLARSKELEWNSIMRLLKLKEEMLERILFKKRHQDFQSKPELDANLNKMYKNFVTSSTTSTDQIKSNRSETSTPTSMSNHVTVTPISSSLTQAAATAAASASAAAGIAAGGSTVNHATSQDFYGSGSLGGKSSPAINSSLSADTVGGKFRPQHRPILPKPPTSSSAAQAAAAQSSSHLAHTLHAVQQAAAAQQAAVSAIQPPHSSSQQQQQQMQQQREAQLSMMQSNAAAAAAAASMLADQNSIIGEGRQGAIVDVKSIIADFRSKNPDSLPRRGRRNVPPFGCRGVPDGGPGPRFLANSSLLSMANIALGSGSHIRTSVSSTTHNDHRPNSFIIGQDNSVPTSMGRTEMQMRHPTIDSLMLSVNHAAAAAAASGNSSQPNSTNSSGSSNNNNDFFRETLVKMAKMSEKRGDMSNAAALHMAGNNKGGGGSHLPPPPPYPEVTLHPVLVPQSSGSPPVQNSLLHGILTKSNAAAAAAAAQAASNQHHPSSTVGNTGSVGGTSVGNIQHRPTTFSPTLARLLTAPERSRGHRSSMGSSGRTTKSTLSEILNSKKTRTEVTITPVTTSTSSVTKNGSDVVLVDDDDESEVADRLVIDEGREVAAESASNVIPADQVPECQGCHKKAAQFVCAGCGNQWYCSRECQVQAWEDHSEMCSG